MSQKGQVVTSAAEVYEEFFLPALFQEWTSRVADGACIQPGDGVIDVACGTGVLAEVLDDEQYQLLLVEAEQELKAFVSDDGGVSFVIPAHIIKGTKPCESSTFFALL